MNPIRPFALGLAFCQVVLCSSTLVINLERATIRDERGQRLEHFFEGIKPNNRPGVAQALLPRPHGSCSPRMLLQSKDSSLGRRSSEVSTFERMKLAVFNIFSLRSVHAQQDCPTCDLPENCGGSYMTGILYQCFAGCGGQYYHYTSLAGHGAKPQ